MLKAAGRLTIVGTMKNRLAQDLRNLVGHIAFGLSPVRHAFADNMAEVTIGYPDSPLNGPAVKAGPKPGERIAPMAGQPPVGSGSLPRFALFAAPDPAVHDLIRRHSALLDPVLRPPLQKGGIWLARPDGYVACAADDAMVLGRYLDDLAR